MIDIRNWSSETRHLAWNMSEKSSGQRNGWEEAARRQQLLHP